MNRERWSPSVRILGIVLYVVACGVPSVYWDDGLMRKDVIRLGSLPGWFLLAVGWTLLPWSFPWLANPIWLIGVIYLLMKKHPEAWWCGVAASLIGLGRLVTF